MPKPLARPGPNSARSTGELTLFVGQTAVWSNAEDGRVSVVLATDACQ